MGRPDDGHANLVIALFSEITELIDKVRNVDEAIESMVWKLERLRAERSALKKGFLRALNKCKRVYASGLFEVLSESIGEKIAFANDRHLRESESLLWASKQMTSMRVKIADGENAVKRENVISERDEALSSIRKRKPVSKVRRRLNRTKGYLKGNKGVSRCERDIDLRLDRIDDDRTVNGLRTVYYPVWSENDPKKLTIRSSDEREDDIVFLNVYDPGYYPNPFANYVRRCA